MEEVCVVLFGELRSTNAESEVPGYQFRVLTEFHMDGCEYDLVVEVHGSPLFWRLIPKGAVRPEM